MNNLVIPPSANWYETSILACAPDNTLLYGSRNDIVIIYNSPDDQPSDVKIIPRGHSQRIISTSINKNWGHPHKLLVTAAEDNIIKLWDIETRKKKLGHNAHIGHGKVVGATFAGDDRVISVSEDGIIIVWNTTLNKTNLLKDIFGLKVTITCISTCPHANWLTAFGQRNGLVVVTDLRRQGKVLYKLRGHDKSVLSLAWCPVPLNIFPKDPRNSVGTKDSSNSVSEICPIVSTEDAPRQISEIETSKDDTPDSAQLISSPPKRAEKPETPRKHDICSNLENVDNNERDVGTKDASNSVSEINPIVSTEASTSQISEIETNKDDTPDSAQRISSPPKSPEKPKTPRKYNIWSNLKHVDDDEQDVPDEEENADAGASADASNDFLKECQSLKHLISGSSKSEPVVKKCEENEGRVFIKARRKVPVAQKNLESEDGLESLGREVEEVGDVSTTKEETVTSNDETNKTDEEKARVEETGSKEELTLMDLHKTDDIKEENIETSGIDSKESYTEPNEESKAEDKLDQESTNAPAEVKREIPLSVPEKEEPRREFLLASSGKEGNIYIWRAGTDGRMQTLLSVPSKTSQRRSNKSHADKLWIVLCWISPTVLLSSSKSAELVKWNLPKPKDKYKQYSIIHCDHNSMLFSIAGPIVYLNEHNWLEERTLNVWTTGHDRLLLNTGLSSERKNLACYPTLGNAVTFASSPVDPNRLAIGTAEGMVKVWDLSRPNIKNIVMTSFFQKIQSRVVTLAWHPSNELLLAYGTLEGRVGYMDTNNKSKTPILTPYFFKSQIHKMEWGPVDEKKEILGLFVVAEGKLVVYTTKKSEKEPTEVDTPDDTFVYTCSWKPDYSLLLVGTKTGAVIVYSTQLKILSTHYFQHRLNDLYWHPDAVQSDPSVAEHCYKFAAISNPKEVIICDFKPDNEDVNKIVAKYDRSGEVINCVAWSPYTANQMVIGSDDGTAHVWEFDCNKEVSTYTNPNFEGVLSAIWSPNDPDCVITASKDHTIRVWRISEHPELNETDLKVLRKKVIKEIGNEQSDLLPKGERKQEEAPKAKPPKNNLLPNFYNPKEGPQVLQELRKLFLWKEGLYGAEAGGGDCNCDILRIFGSKSDMLDLVEQNETALQEKGKYNLSNTLSLFKGDISTKIKKAVDERRVNPWIIMMAPMVSPKLWQSACEVYAQQLSETTDSDPIEIATFYLACHKLEAAIDALCDGTMFREAFTLAKCRLPEDSPAVTKILERWAKYAVAVGNFEVAAQCYIFLGRYEDAASVLFRRSDLETLTFALELAEKSGNEDLHKAILFRYNAYENEGVLGDQEGELPSRLDVALKQHLQNGEENGTVGESEETQEESGRRDVADEKGVLVGESVEIKERVKEDTEDKIAEIGAVLPDKP